MRAPACGLALLLLLGLTPAARAQDAPVDVEADRLIGTRTEEGEIVLLRGNVVLRQGTTVVRSEQGRWIKAQQRVVLTGGVTATDGTLRITGRQADYVERSNLITVSGDVRVVDRNLEIQAMQASYETRTRRAELWGNVRGEDRGRRLEADRVLYFRDRQTAEAQGNVSARDSSGQTLLVAQFLEHDRENDRTRAWGSPRLTRLEEDGDVILTGDTLRVDHRNEIARAIGNVRVERDTLNASAQYAIFWDAEERGLLFGSPKAWNREVEATGDTIEIFSREGDIERASVRGDSQILFVSATPETFGERNRLLAPHIEIYFGGDAVDSLLAVDGAVNRYEGPPTPGRLAETNEARGARVTVYFEEDVLDRAVFTGAPEGAYRFDLAETDSARIAAETVTYSGERIVYKVQERRIGIEGEAKLQYQNMDLRAGRVEFDSRREELIARDDPVLEDSSGDAEALRGRTMTYDMNTRTGTVYQAATEFDRGFYTGRAIHDAGDDVLLVRDAHYTTCDAADPHWFLGANRMKIQLRDKIIARPIVFYLKRIPLLALPFYVLPIEPDRHSGILFPRMQFGFNSQSGRFIRNLGYYWAPNDYMDFTVSGDYYDLEPSWVLRGEGRYRVLGQVDGQFDARYTGSRAFLGRDQWDVRASHNQVIGTRTRLTAQAEFTSSRDFTRDPRTGEPLANRLDRFLVSTLNLNHREPWGTMNFFLSRRQDLDTDPVASPLPRLIEDLPQFSLSLPQRTLGRVGTDTRPGFLEPLASVTYSYNLRAVNHRETRTTLTGDSVTSQIAARGQLNLSDHRRLPGGITLSPRLSTAHVIFEEDARGQRWQPAAVYNLGVGASATYYGTFRTGIGPLAGIRHILFPQVGYSWQPEFESLTFVDTSGIRRTRFPSVAGISISGFRQSFLSYSLQQRFQFRFRKGDGFVTLPNLITLTTRGGYDFRWRENGLPTPWRPLTNTLLIQPPQYLTLNASMSHSFDVEPNLRSINLSAQLRLAGGSGGVSPVADLPLEGNEALATESTAPLGGPWSVNLSYSYAAGRDAFGNWVPNQTANSLVAFSPTQKWHLNYYNTIDLDNGDIVAQEYSVARNLHCWQASFVRRFTTGGESEFYFRISLVERPEIYLEQGTRGLGTFSGF